jgi:hypothetical protein
VFAEGFLSAHTAFSTTKTPPRLTTVPLAPKPASEGPPPASAHSRGPGAHGEASTALRASRSQRSSAGFDSPSPPDQSSRPVRSKRPSMRAFRRIAVRYQNQPQGFAVVRRGWIALFAVPNSHEVLPRYFWKEALRRSVNRGGLPSPAAERADLPGLLPSPSGCPVCLSFCRRRPVVCAPHSCQ